ncbi:hypothetical protein DHB64_09475 [Antarcticibacterium sp. W02-3]|nr:hypothetical protein [Antarcticibacterium sp. W02-3]
MPIKIFFSEENITFIGYIMLFIDLRICSGASFATTKNGRYQSSGPTSSGSGSANCTHISLLAAGGLILGVYYLKKK